MTSVKQTDSLSHDLEVLLRYAGANKAVLTPKRQSVPVKLIRDIMKSFKVQEPHDDVIGGKVHKKREEREYPRFYFLDLLAAGAEFLSISRGGRFRKGPYWKVFFETSEEDRAYLLLHVFRCDFDFESWFMGRGGGFGARLRDKIHHPPWVSLN
jgi:hypothetical protein